MILIMDINYSLHVYKCFICCIRYLLYVVSLTYSVLHEAILIS